MATCSSPGNGVLGGADIQNPLLCNPDRIDATPTISNSNTASLQNDETDYTPGVQPLTTADLATPSGLAAASSCQVAGSANIAVSLSWSDSQNSSLDADQNPLAHSSRFATTVTTQNSSLDADQNPLLSGYTVWQSASQTGPFTQVGSVTSSGSTQAATSYTDVNPTVAPTPYAYVANVNAGTVSVVDTSTNAVTTTITLTEPAGGYAPIPTALAVTPNGCSVYVTDFDNDIEDVIDTSSNTVTTTITLTDAPNLEPFGIAITPNDQAAYVPTYYNYSASTYTTIVDPLDLSNNTLGSTITVGSGPYAVAVQPSTYYYEVQAYATNWTSAYSAVIPITLGFVY